jgi:hypothetical protein
MYMYKRKEIMFLKNPIRQKAIKIAGNHYDTWLPSAVEENMTKKGILTKEPPRNLIRRAWMEIRFTWELRSRYWALVNTIENQLEKENNGVDRSEARPVI